MKPVETTEKDSIIVQPAGALRGLTQRVESVPLANALDVFKATLIHLADATQEAYEAGVLEFLAWLQSRGVEETGQIRPVHLKDYRAEWQALIDSDQYKPSTVANKKLTPVRRFLLCCMTEGFCAPAITRERIESFLKDPPDPRRGRLPTYLEAEEIEDLLNVVTDRRDLALLTLALGSGLRVTELVSLRVGDLQPQGDVGGGPAAAILEVRRGKGRKPRSFKIPGSVFGPIQAYVEETSRSWRDRSDLEGRLFQSYGANEALSRIRVYQLLRAYTKQAELTKPVTPHVLRHTFATQYIANGGNPVALAEILGHAGLDYVMTYVHVGRLITGDTYDATWLPEAVQTRFVA